ncbi:c-type cytochrome [Reichenbachiella versicolor]|uniref:c-type cytochrome n=1 Tax=Reichenbachiella versicolor TaxID=1821036 RepID=UPI000D6E50C7|nr:cytochrome c [Reichenbachiella versicolor]
MKSKAAISIILFITPIFVACSQDVKLKQYIAKGEELYLANCIHCHQADGSGLAAVIPPVNSDFSIKNKAFSICVIKNGLQGEIEVEGQTYNGNMPSVAFTDLELAELITYLNNSWGKQESITTISEVEDALKNCR